MAVTFNRLVRPGMADTRERVLAESHLARRSAADTMVFLSHKTGDAKALEEARYIAEKHRVQVYMAEWDDQVYGDSAGLPDHIMKAIRETNGFLVNVIAEIATSMWIGYEIGGAHAMRKARAKLIYEPVPKLPSVVGALSSLRNRGELDRWIVRMAR